MGAGIQVVLNTASDNTKEIIDKISIRLHDTRQETAWRRETFSELPGFRVVSRKQAQIGLSAVQYRALNHGATVPVQASMMAARVGKRGPSAADWTKDIEGFILGLIPLRAIPPALALALVSRNGAVGA